MHEGENDNVKGRNMKDYQGKLIGTKSEGGTSRVTGKNHKVVPGGNENVKGRKQGLRGRNKRHTGQEEEES